MPPKPKSKASAKSTAYSHKWQALNADQQPAKRSHCVTKTNNNNEDDKNNDNDINPEDAAMADFEEKAMKTRKMGGKGGKEATAGQGKKAPTIKCIVHTIDGNHAIDCVLSPPHLNPTDPTPQKNRAGPPAIVRMLLSNLPLALSKCCMYPHPLFSFLPPPN